MPSTPLMSPRPRTYAHTDTPLMPRTSRIYSEPPTPETPMDDSVCMFATWCAWRVFCSATDRSVCVSTAQDTIFEGAYFLWSFYGGPLQLLRLDSISEGAYSWRENTYDMYIDPDHRHQQFDSDEVRHPAGYGIPAAVWKRPLCV